MAANWSSTTPQAPEGGLNVKWQKDGSGNISAYFLRGAAQTPWTQDIDAAGYSLRNTKFIVQRGDIGHSWNLEEVAGVWRHVANGYGNVMTGSLGDGYLRIYTSQYGAAGSVASLKEVALIGPSNVLIENAQLIVGASSKLVCGNQSGERIRVYGTEGGINYAMGIESSCLWSQVEANAVFRWYCGVAPDNGATARLEIAATYIKTIAPVRMLNMPTSTSGLSSGALWRDAAAGNVVKIVP